MRQARLRSAWASAQSDHSLRCSHGETLDPLSAQRRSWSDWVDAHADLSLCKAQMSCADSGCITTTTTTITTTNTTTTNTTTEQCLYNCDFYMPRNYLRFNFTAAMLPAYIVAMATLCRVGFLIPDFYSLILHWPIKDLTYLIIAYALTDLQIQFTYVVFVWILNS